MAESRSSSPRFSPPTAGGEGAGDACLRLRAGKLRARRPGSSRGQFARCDLHPHRQQFERTHEPERAVQRWHPIVEEITRLAFPQDAGAIGMQPGGVVAALRNHRLCGREPSGFKGEAEAEDEMT